MLYEYCLSPPSPLDSLLDLATLICLPVTAESGNPLRDVAAVGGEVGESGDSWKEKKHALMVLRRRD